MKRKILKYKITDDKYQTEFFPGSGTAFISSMEAWDDAVTGVGQTAKEAYNNAIDILKKRGFDTSNIHYKKFKPVDETTTDKYLYYITIKVRC